MSAVLPHSFYRRENVIVVAKDLLGKILVTEADRMITSGIIVETEAYRGYGDAACHAHMSKKTDRNKIMYANGGLAYVYLCYGIHHLFNIVTNTEGHADAVLIRALEPLQGVEYMMERRKKPKPDYSLTKGPGSLSSALGISKLHYGTDLTLKHKVWIEDTDLKFKPNQIEKGPRIGIDYSGEAATYPWRFWVKGNKWVSR